MPVFKVGQSLIPYLANSEPIFPRNWPFVTFHHGQQKIVVIFQQYIYNLFSLVDVKEKHFDIWIRERGLDYHEFLRSRLVRIFERNFLNRDTQQQQIQICKFCIVGPSSPGANCFSSESFRICMYRVTMPASYHDVQFILPEISDPSNEVFFKDWNAWDSFFSRMKSIQTDSIWQRDEKFLKSFQYYIKMSLMERHCVANRTSSMLATDTSNKTLKEDDLFTLRILNQFPLPKIDWNMDDNTLDSKCANLYQCYMGKHFLPPFSMNLLSVREFEPKQQTALNAKHGDKKKKKAGGQSTSEEGITPWIEFVKCTHYSDVSIGAVYYVNNYVSAAASNSKLQKEVDLYGVWDFKFLKNIVDVPMKISVVGISKLYNQLVYATVSFAIQFLEEITSYIEQSVLDEITHRPQVTLYWYTPYTIGIRGAYIQNKIHHLFMKKFPSKTEPIPTSQQEEASMSYLSMVCLRDECNEGHPFEIKSEICGPLSNIGSVRPLNEATNQRAYNKTYNIDTVVDATIVHSGLAIPENTKQF